MKPIHYARQKNKNCPNVNKVVVNDWTLYYASIRICISVAELLIAAPGPNQYFCAHANCLYNRLSTQRRRTCFIMRSAQFFHCGLRSIIANSIIKIDTFRGVWVRRMFAWLHVATATARNLSLVIYLRIFFAPILSIDVIIAAHPILSHTIEQWVNVAAATVSASVHSIDWSAATFAAASTVVVYVFNFLEFVQSNVT